MRKLRLTWQRMRSVPGLKRDLALLTVVVLVGVAVTGYLLSKYHQVLPWSDRYEFAAEFDMAPAIQLASNQEVRIAGVPVGRIADAEPTDDGKARLKFSLEPGHQVFDNARLVVRSKSPLNVIYVALDPGGAPGKPLPDGGVIPDSQTERVLQPFELVDQLDSRAQAALSSLVEEADVALADAPRDLPGGLRATDATMASFRPVVEQLQKRRESLRRIVTSVARVSAAAGTDDKRLATLAASLEQTLSVIATRDKELGATLAELPGMTKVLRESMASTRELTDELTPALEQVHAATGKLPPALARLAETVDEAGSLVRAARPVVAKGKPVVADLRPLAGDLNGALGDLRPVVRTLPSATKRIVPWLDDLGAFVYQTSSSFSLADVNGGLGRAQVVFRVDNPTGGGTDGNPIPGGVK